MRPARSLRERMVDRPIASHDVLNAKTALIQHVDNVFWSPARARVMPDKPTDVG